MSGAAAALGSNLEGEQTWTSSVRACSSSFPFFLISRAFLGVGRVRVAWRRTLLWRRCGVVSTCGGLERRPKLLGIAVATR